MTIGRIDIAALDPRQRAELIYDQARAELSDQLWQAVLGDSGVREPRGDRRPAAADASLRSLMVMLGGDAADAAARLQPAPAWMPPAVAPQHDRGDRRDRRHDGERDPDGAARGLAANADYAGTIDAAASRTGLPAPVLTAIIHAEAATGADGRWQTMSRNPHSSAAGLGQFLTGTWISETERAGTWLNAAAHERGWIDQGGRLLAAARAPLLAMRYDGAAAIHAIADYAGHNLSQLRAAGIRLDGSVRDLARGAYIGHHLGARDAIRFLTGGLAPDRARMLLKAQIGVAAANQRIAVAGDSVQAHRQWLTAYVERSVKTLS
ncbi:peptidoglycan-binding protein [Sphingomonas sp. M6A6_1c]